MSFPRYPDYKDSGVEWLGEVPGHWEVRRLGFYFEERREKVSDKDFEPLSVTKNGIVPQLETAAKTDDNDNRKKVCAGDFVINSRSDRKGSGGLSDRDGSVSLINTVLAPRREIQGLFAHHLLRSVDFQEEFYRWGKGIVADLWSTNFSEMRNILLAVPTPNEQSAIAAFLDRETAKIDALVTEQEKLIALLKEKRQAVISHAVTACGGVSTRLGHHLDLLAGYAFPSEGFSDDADDIRLLRGINVGVGRVRWDEVVYWPNHAAAALDRYGLEVGDLVFGLDRPWIGSGIRVAEISADDVPSLLLQRVARLRPKSALRSEFLKLLLMSKAFFGHFEPELTGVSVPHISPDQILSYRFCLPSEEDQMRVANEALTVLESMDRTEIESQRAIELLKEHRSALISAAVTGKIDVRGLISPQEAA